MPERLSVQRFESPAVQGEDSYVVVRGLTVAGVRALRSEGVTNEEGLAILGGQVADWNWVWEDGTAMPLPSLDPAVMGKLSNAEAAFLFDALWKVTSLSAEQLKNSVSAS